MTDQSAISEVRARHRAERASAASDPMRRAAILEAAERVLERTPVHELSVAQIISEAGVARATFYAYFESKYEVIAALMDSVMVQMYDLLLPFAEREPDVSPRAALFQVLTESARLWHRHSVVFRATHDHRHAVPELANQWLRVTEQFTDAVAAEIDRDVAAGLAPGDRDTRQLAASLVWASEHLFYVAGSGLDDDLPSEEAIVETLVNLWMGAIYPTFDCDPDAPGPAGAPSPSRRVR